MGFFSDLFTRRNHRAVENLLNPLLKMKLQEFVIADDDSVYMKHYFRFKNKKGTDEEFVVIYRRFDLDLHYLRTHRKCVGEDRDFRTIGSTWHTAIAYLIELGGQLSRTTRPTRGHFVSKVSAGDLLDPNWVPPATSPDTTTRDAMKPSVSCDEWHVERKTSGFDEPSREELSRIYHFSGLKSPETTATLRIVCTLESSLLGGLDGEMSLGRRLRFYLWPFRLPHDASFTMRLFTMDRTQGGEFNVTASPVEGDSDTALIARYGGPDDVANCLTSIMSGKHMTFMLADETESLVNFGLPNDHEFKRLYDETCDRLSQREIANEVMRQNARPRSN